MTGTSQLPLVTVVTPSYNQGQFIEETILSVLNQDYPHIEFLIIDGGSSDDTLHILRKYTDRLHWVSEPDRGQSHAINKGFRKAKGDIVAWLNSDDLYERDAVSRAVEFLTFNPEIKLVYGRANFINENGDVIGEDIHSKNHDLWVLANELDYIVQPTVFFRKKVLDVVGYLDEKLNWVLDWELWIRICFRFPAHFLDFNMASLRIHKLTKTSNGGFLRYFEIVNLLNKYSSNSSFLTYIRYGLNMITEYLSTRAPIGYRYISNIFNPLRTLLRSHIANEHGVYADKWLGRKARFMFPFNAEATEIRFSLSFPRELVGEKAGITAYINKRKYIHTPLPPSETCELILPYDAILDKPTEVELSFSHCLPKDSQGRKLSCKLESVSFTVLTPDALFPSTFQVQQK